MRGDRFGGLPDHMIPGGLRVVETGSFGSRLLGLALLGDLESDTALLLRRCRSVHTLGMMFDIDVVFLDGRGQVVRTACAVPPGRLVVCRSARAILETPARRSHRFLVAGAGALAAEPVDLAGERRFKPRSFSRRRRADAAGRSAPTAPAPR